MLRLSSPWITYTLLLTSPLPLLLYGIHIFSKMEHLCFLEKEALRIKGRAVAAEQIEKKESILLVQSDPHYLDKHIEALHFLLPEIKKWERAVSENPENEELFHIVEHLKSSDNRLLFSEASIKQSDTLKEVEEVQQYSVDMNEEDLKRLLCLIEGTTIWPYGPREGKPLFIITDFKLSKKEVFDSEKVFTVSMKILKRERL